LIKGSANKTIAIKIIWINIDIPKSVWVRYEIRVSESNEENMEVPRISETLNSMAKNAVQNQSKVRSDAFFFTASAASLKAPSLLGIKIEVDSKVPIAAKASR
jgi:hypothetical protein